MNFGDTMKTTYATIVYDYLMSNGIFNAFLHNREYAINSSGKSKCLSEPINYAIVWDQTPEGHAFWDRHNDVLRVKLQDVRCDISIDELIERLYELSQVQQPYEFW